MRNRVWIVTGIVGALGGAVLGGLAIAQEAPESLLPPGFANPTPTPSPPPSPAPLPTAAPVPAAPLAPAPPAPAADENAPLGPITLPPVSELSDEELRDIPTLEELEMLTTDELDDLFGLKPKYDIPPAARRSLAQVGVIAPEEGGFQVESLNKQPAALVRAMLQGTDTPLVSRWGHILMRRALASRMQAPEGMNPVEFAALRAGALNRMGEYAVARALIQDVDTGNWSEALANEALTSSIADIDPVGVCPFVRLRGAPEASEERASQWKLIGAICNAYAGETALAGSQLDAALNEDISPAIDVLLARRFAGAAGRGQRAVSIEWDGVNTLNPWRFAMANAVGEPLPPALLEDVGPYYARTGASAAMLPLAQRAEYASRAVEEGLFSAQAMVDLYSEVYSDAAIGGLLGERARLLRTAYLAPEPSGRINAMETLWSDGSSGDAHWAQVLTAYAAARIPPAQSSAAQADGLISSMLAAGLDRDALAWKPFVEQGSLGWALITLSESDSAVVPQTGLDLFVDNDDSDEYRKSQFLIAGLAGLGRVGAADQGAFDSRLSLGLERETRWARTIARAAEVRNPALVAMLVGLGMQGDDWSQMTPLHLYHITSALVRVGLRAEARMIAAEAVSRS
ncbi:MAG: hypothetical protein AAFR64_07360 [Pseudomonadota bacterium]